MGLGCDEAPRPVDGRWPANVVHDGSREVTDVLPGVGDDECVARFFYTAKATEADRIGSVHPTVKPVDLMRWLVRLVTPPGGTVLDPFAGSGTTGMAAMAEGLAAALIERDPEYADDITRRLRHVAGGNPGELFAPLAANDND